MFLFMEIITNFTISTENSCFCTYLNMRWNIFKGYFFTTLTSNSPKWTRLYMLKGLIVIKYSTIILTLVLIISWNELAFKLLLFQLLFSKSMNRQKSSFSTSNWTSSFIHLRILINPLIYTFFTKSCLTFLAFLRI